MIKIIQLLDFQNHRNRRIELDPSVTVLAGDNGKGKTAIIRALRWCLLNEWDGKADQFIHWEAQDAKVQALVDGVWVVRAKGSKGNRYYLGKEKFSAFGAGVPAPIEKLVNLHADCFQNQLDGVFWFSLTDGQLAKQLNQIVNLGEIDESLARAASQVSKTKAQVEVHRERKRAVEEELDGLGWIATADEQLSTILAESEHLDTIKEQKDRLSRLVSLWKELTAALGRVDSLQNRGTQLLGQAKEGVGTLNTLQRVRQRAKRYSELESRLCQLNKRIVKIEESLKNTQCPICGK